MPKKKTDEVSTIKTEVTQNPSPSTSSGQAQSKQGKNKEKVTSKMWAEKQLKEMAKLGGKLVL